MADAADVTGIADILLASKLSVTRYFPKPKLDFDAAIGLTGNTAGDQFLCAGSAPIDKFRRRFDVHVFPGKRLRINDFEYAALLEIRSNGQRE